jgi:hypothetical protein
LGKQRFPGKNCSFGTTIHLLHYFTCAQNSGNHVNALKRTTIIFFDTWKSSKYCKFDAEFKSELTINTLLLSNVFVLFSEVLLPRKQALKDENNPENDLYFFGIATNEKLGRGFFKPDGLFFFI